MYEIYVIGSMELMRSVLNAVASMTANGSVAGNGQLISLGLILSILFVVVKAIISQKLELQYFFISLVLYLAMFAPKVTVHLEEVSTGAVVNVANVPVGIAAIGSLASTIGTSLSQSYETLFSIPGITDGGYITPLRILASARNPHDGVANTLGAIPVGGTTTDVKKSINNYLVDCVYVDIYAQLPNQNVTEASIKAADATNLWDTLKVTSGSWFTTTFLTNGNPGGNNVTCTDAWAALDTALTTYSNLSIDYLVKNNGDPLFETTADQAITTLTGSAITMQEFMLASFLRNSLENAKSGYFAQAGDVAMTTMLTQSKTQRQIQWAAEKDMFEEVAKPLISAIEAFFYAVSPIMIFLVLLGSFGWGIFLKYVILAIWIQLWMPILTVNNHFILISVQKAFAGLAASGADFTTGSGMEQTWSTLSTWVATGGMLAAATPLMALMIVTGSFYAFTKLTDRMAGQDHVNEKQMAPDLTQPAPVVAMGAMRQNAPLSSHSTGGGVTTAGYGIPSITYGSDSSQQTASQRQELQTASSAFDASLSTAMGHSSAYGASKVASSGYAHNYSSSESRADQLSYKLAEDITRGSNASEDYKSQLAGQIGLGLSRGSGGNDPKNAGEKFANTLLKASKGLPVSGSFDKTFNLQESISNTLGHKNAAGKTRGESIASEYRDAVAYDLREGESSFLSDGYTKDDRANFAATDRDLAAKTDQFSQTWAQNEGRRSTVTKGLDELSQTAENNPAFAQDLGRLINSSGLANDVDSNMNAVRGIGASASDPQRRLAAELYTLDHADSGTVSQLDSLISEHVLGTGVKSYGDNASQFEGIAGDVQSSGSVMSRVANVIPTEAELTPPGGSNDAAYQSNISNMKQDHASTVANAKANETSSGTRFTAEQRLTDNRMELLEKDINSLGFIADIGARGTNPVDYARAHFSPSSQEAIYEKEALDAGWSQESATLYGYVATNSLRNGGDVDDTDVYTDKIAELSKGYDETVVRAMSHYSQFDDDVRGSKLKNMNDIKGITD